MAGRSVSDGSAACKRERDPRPDRRPARASDLPSRVAEKGRSLPCSAAVAPNASTEYRRGRPAWSAVTAWLRSKPKPSAAAETRWLRCVTDTTVDHTGIVADGDLDRLNLDVYDTDLGLWCPEHGDVELPDGWEYLAPGDTFVTRRVKASGVYWTLWRPRGRHRPHRRKLGVLAPSPTINAARAEAVTTAERRAAQRVVNTAARERAEARYRVELAAAVRAWLDFTPEHAGLATEIAEGVAGHAAVVGSGRVGRTRTLPVEERARLAARAFIRHRFTDYEDRLGDLDVFLAAIDDVDYREVKQDAQARVDQFLADHRAAP
jgi:hypothetical protein